MVEREKFNDIEERLRAIEGGGDYPFVDIEVTLPKYRIQK